MLGLPGAATYLFNYNGIVTNGWPKYTRGTNAYGPICADIDGYGGSDIITTSIPDETNPGRLVGVYAWNSSGNLLSGFPKYAEVDTRAPVVVSDLDSDGRLELIASSNFDFDQTAMQSKSRGSVYAWKLAGLINPWAFDWATFQHDIGRTGRYTRSYSVEVDHRPRSTAKSIM